MERTSQIPIRLLAAIAGLFLLVGCGSDDDGGDAAVTTTAVSSNTGTGTGQDGTDEGPEDINDFCGVDPNVHEPTDPSYFGSPEHTDQLREMAEVAPDTVADDIDLIVEHFEQGVEPADSDAEILDGLPGDVADAVRRVIGYALITCP